ncbi:DMT family transporter [Thalassovita sp.]|uniref:DMT family transporter n=1 Tax=Thalassovita sp. TaxID=1979401 RepID=UPI0029DE68FB|nr:DMT family transporter [Thalassovita sp.]
MTPKDANLRGAVFMVLAMAAFAVEDVLYKSASQHHPAGQALFLFGAMGMGLFAVLSVIRRERIWHPAMLTTPLLIRSGFELGGRLFYALALAMTPLASTSAILQATPLVVALGAVLVFGETVGWRRWLAMAVGFAGVLLILRPLPGSFQVTSVFAVLGMIGFAGRDLATRASPATMSMAQLGTLGFAVVSLAGVVLSVARGESLAAPGVFVLLRLAGASAVGVLAYGALTQAMRSGEIGFVAPFRYTRLVFALVLAVLVFGERPDQLTLLGGAVIVASGLYSLLRQRKAV